MISDTYPSTLATGVPFGAGIVSWGDFATGVAAYEEDPIRPPAENVGFAVWKDMVEEPWKYGDDIGDWLVLDAELRAGPGRWRLEAYWMQVEQRQNWERLEAMLWKAWNDYLTRKERAVVRIQAAVRGQFPLGEDAFHRLADEPGGVESRNHHAQRGRPACHRQCRCHRCTPVLCASVALRTISSSSRR